MALRVEWSRTVSSGPENSRMEAAFVPSFSATVKAAGQNVVKPTKYHIFGRAVVCPAAPVNQRQLLRFPDQKRTFRIRPDCRRRTHFYDSPYKRLSYEQGGAVEIKSRNYQADHQIFHYELTRFYFVSLGCSRTQNCIDFYEVTRCYKQMVVFHKCQCAR